MPKTAAKKSKKEVVSTSESASGSESDASSKDTPAPAPKRKNAGSAKSGKNRVDDIDGQPTWKLSAQRNVTVSEFKGRVYVNIREYYEKDGKLLPGKKGISLPQAQWEALLESADDITAVLKEKQ